jgi:hypothetical protein
MQLATEMALSLYQLPNGTAKRNERIKQHHLHEFMHRMRSWGLRIRTQIELRKTFPHRKFVEELGACWTGGIKRRGEIGVEE